MKDYILVGVDGTPASLSALRWAVDAADQRGLAIRVVRAYQNDLDRWPAIGTAGYVPPPMVLDKFEHELDEAVQIARNRLGDERATGRLVDMDPAHALLREAVDAELVVIGTRSPNKLSAAFLGSVASSVAAKAACPVVVVRGARRTGPIVAGTDGSADSDDAVAFAFQQADLTGEPLEVVYCWQPQTEYAASVAGTEQLLTNWLAESIAPYRDKYPAVKVRAAVVKGRARAQLIKLSRTASAVVVGSRGRGGVKGLLLGSVSQSLLHHADSPVVIVSPHKES